MVNIINEYVNTNELNKFNSKKYKQYDVVGNLLFSCEKNENDEWIDTTDIEKLKIEIAKETEQLKKMTKKEI